jgi:hypothetical protein
MQSLDISQIRERRPKTKKASSTGSAEEALKLARFRAGDQAKASASSEDPQYRHAERDTSAGAAVLLNEKRDLEEVTRSGDDIRRLPSCQTGQR